MVLKGRQSVCVMKSMKHYVSQHLNAENECLEEEEDIRDGMKALAEESDTMDWTTFKKDYLDRQD